MCVCYTYTYTGEETKQLSCILQPEKMWTYEMDIIKGKYKEKEKSSVRLVTVANTYWTR